MRWSLVLALAGCGGRAQQPQLVQQAPAGGVPVLDADGDRAYVADRRGLHEVALTGAHQLVGVPPIEWCSVDAKARVVWFVDATGLAAFDLDDRRLYPVVLDRLFSVGIVIDHGEQVLLPLRVRPVQLVIEIRDTPALHVDAQCPADDEACRALRDHLAQISLSDPTYVGSLAARSQGGMLWASGPMPPIAPDARRPVFVAPTGEPSYGGTVQAGEREVFTPEAGGMSCGWASGGWRAP